MDTLSVTTRNEQYGKTTAARVNTQGLKEGTFHLDKGTRILLFSLVYILNGNHDPKKVQGLNLVLLALFFAIGFFFNQDFLPFGFAFSGIVLVNGIIVLVVQKLGDNVWNPLGREITVYIHHSLQKHGRL